VLSIAFQAAWPWQLSNHTALAAIFVQDTDPGEVAGNGPDSKTIERYLEALCRHDKAQKLVIPVTLTTSAVVTKDMLAYVKPHVQVNDALIEQVLILFPLLPVLLFPPCLPACLPACLPFPLLPSSYLFYFRRLPPAPLAVPCSVLHSDLLSSSFSSLAGGFLSPCPFFLSLLTPCPSF